MPPDELVVHTKKDGTDVVEVEILSPNADKVAEKASGLSDEELAKLGATKIVEREKEVEKEVFPLWAVLLIVGVCVMCGVAMFVVWRKKKASTTTFIHGARTGPDGASPFDGAKEMGALTVPELSPSPPMSVNGIRSQGQPVAADVLEL